MFLRLIKVIVTEAALSMVFLRENFYFLNVLVHSLIILKDILGLFSPLPAPPRSPPPIQYNMTLVS